MVWIRTLWVAAVLAALVPVLSCETAAARCAMCHREECRNLAFTIHLTDGSKVDMCCPRCALRYLARENPDVARLEVRDFATAKRLDARTATFVEGSDVHPCSASHEGPPKDERGCCLAPVYDRCLPSVLAFADRGTAEAFARQHGGFVKPFDALESPAQ